MDIETYVVEDNLVPVSDGQIPYLYNRYILHGPILPFDIVKHKGKKCVVYDDEKDA